MSLRPLIAFCAVLLFGAPLPAQGQDVALRVIELQFELYGLGSEYDDVVVIVFQKIGNRIVAATPIRMSREEVRRGWRANRVEEQRSLREDHGRRFDTFALGWTERGGERTYLAPIEIVYPGGVDTERQFSQRLKFLPMEEARVTNHMFFGEQSFFHDPNNILFVIELIRLLMQNDLIEQEPDRQFIYDFLSAVSLQFSDYSRIEKRRILEEMTHYLTSDFVNDPAVYRSQFFRAMAVIMSEDGAGTRVNIGPHRRVRDYALAQMTTLLDRHVAELVHEVRFAQLALLDSEMERRSMRACVALSAKALAEAAKGEAEAFDPDEVYEVVHNSVRCSQRYYALEVGVPQRAILEGFCEMQADNDFGRRYWRSLRRLAQSELGREVLASGIPDDPAQLYLEMAVDQELDCTV